MKKKWMVVMTAILAMSSTVPALAQHIYAGDDVEKVVSYDENGRKSITLIFDPAKMPDEVREQLGLASLLENKENTTKLEWTIVNKKDTIFKYIFWERLDSLPIPECCFHFIWCQIA